MCSAPIGTALLPLQPNGPFGSYQLAPRRFCIYGVSMFVSPERSRRHLGGATTRLKAAKKLARHDASNHPVTANETYDAWDA